MDTPCTEIDWTASRKDTGHETVIDSAAPTLYFREHHVLTGTTFESMLLIHLQVLANPSIW